MRNEQKTMNKKKNFLLCSLLFAICSFAVLFGGCDTTLNSLGGYKTPKSGYGKVIVNVQNSAGLPKGARTIFPDAVDYEYVYKFNGTEVTPEDDGSFTLEANTYTVLVEAKIDAAIVASGSGIVVVAADGITPVTITLTPNAVTGDGYFKYKITYDAGITVTVNLKEWDGDSIVLENPSPVSGDIITATVPAGAYLLTVSATNGAGAFAGKMEVVYIYRNFTTSYTDLEFKTSDLIAADPVTIKAIELTSPEQALLSDDVPQEEINTDQFTGTVVWTNFAGTIPNAFAARTPYKATITLTPKEDFTFQDDSIVEDFFEIEDAVTTFDKASQTITAMFALTPIAGDYTLTNNSQLTTGQITAVVITPKGSNGQATNIQYKDSLGVVTSTVPSTVGIYEVTFDVAEVKDASNNVWWKAETDIVAGNLTIASHRYTITTSAGKFNAEGGGKTFSEDAIQEVISAILTEVGTDNSVIVFGTQSTPLDIGAEEIALTGEAEITLEGSLISSSNSQTGIIQLIGDVSLNSSANITVTGTGIAIVDGSSGNVQISGGTITVGDAVAVTSISTITVKGGATITSANEGLASGTIYLTGNDDGSLILNGGTITNRHPGGYAIYNASTSGTIVIDGNPVINGIIRPTTTGQMEVTSDYSGTLHYTIEYPGNYYAENAIAVKGGASHADHFALHNEESLPWTVIAGASNNAVIAKAYDITLSHTGTNQALYEFDPDFTPTSAGTPLTVTVRNTGHKAADLDIKLSGPGASEFRLSRNDITDLAVNGSETFTVGPIAGRNNGGTHNATVTVSGGGNPGDDTYFYKDFDVRIEVTVSTYEIVLNESGTFAFDDKYLNYATAEEKPVTITNNGNRPTGALSIAASGASFDVDPDSINNIAADGGEESFVVKPKLNLGIGVYTATVTVSGSHGLSGSFDVTFEVTATPTHRIQLVTTPATNTLETYENYPNDSVEGLEIELQSTGTHETGAVTISQTGGAYFDLSDNSFGSLYGTSHVSNVGERKQFTVTPKNSLGVGTYTTLVTANGVQAGDSLENGITVTFIVYPTPTYTFTLKEDGTNVALTTHNFGETYLGYALPAALSVTVTGTGNTATGALQVALSGFDAAKFQLNIGTVNSVDHGVENQMEAAFTVRPIDSLTLGTHSAVVNVSSTEGHGTLVQFTVTYTLSTVPTYTISLGSDKTLDTITLDEDYGTAAEYFTVTVRNTGSRPTGALVITKESDDDNAFSLVGDGTLGSIAENETATFRVNIANGLDVITIEGENGADDEKDTATYSANFSVQSSEGHATIDNSITLFVKVTPADE